MTFTKLKHVKFTKYELFKLFLYKRYITEYNVTSEKNNSKKFYMDTDLFVVSFETDGLITDSNNFVGKTW